MFAQCPNVFAGLLRGDAQEVLLLSYRRTRAGLGWPLTLPVPPSELIPNFAAAALLMLSSFLITLTARPALHSTIWYDTDSVWAKLGRS